MCKSVENEMEYAFVQRAEVLSDSEMKVHKSGAMLGCIRLQWQRAKREECRLFCSCEFRIVPAEAIRGTVHVVLRNTYIPIIDKNDLRAANHFKLGDDRN